MFKFLFGKKQDGTAVVETQRETVARALAEINEILTLTEGAAVSVTTGTGQIDITLPEQMPDEALALPAPETDAGAEVQKAA